jgi:hypothetical protein
MQPRLHRPEQHDRAGRAPDMVVEGPTGLYRRWYELATCPIHKWAGPSVSMIEDTAPVCWQGGHLLDEAGLRRGFGR